MTPILQTLLDRLMVAAGLGVSLLLFLLMGLLPLTELSYWFCSVTALGAACFSILYYRVCHGPAMDCTCTKKEE